jgi:hypothetical protein
MEMLTQIPVHHVTWNGCRPALAQPHLHAGLSHALLRPQAPSAILAAREPRIVRQPCLLAILKR